MLIADFKKTEIHWPGLIFVSWLDREEVDVPALLDVPGHLEEILKEHTMVCGRMLHRRVWYPWCLTGHAD